MTCDLFLTLKLPKHVTYVMKLCHSSMTIMFSELTNDDSESSSDSVINDSTDTNNCKWGDDEMSHHDSMSSMPLDAI